MDTSEKQLQASAWLSMASMNALIGASADAYKAPFRFHRNVPLSVPRFLPSTAHGKTSRLPSLLPYLNRAAIQILLAPNVL